MKSSKLKENEGSNKAAHSYHLQANAIDTSQNPHWDTRHDCKSGSQLLTKMNNRRQPGYEKGTTNSIIRQHTTLKARDHEREN